MRLPGNRPAWLAEFEARFRSRAWPAESGRASAGRARTQTSQTEIRLGLLFGPRAAALLTRRTWRVPQTDTRGRHCRVQRCFADPQAAARYLLAEINRSFARADIPARLVLGATGLFAAEEARPQGPNPHVWLTDLLCNAVASEQGALPIETWAAQQQLNAVLVLLDWGLSRTRIEQGAWGGIAPKPAERRGRHLRFHPLAVADLRCALTAYSAAHEFGHLLGCAHHDGTNTVCSTARGYRASASCFTVMTAAQSREAGRRLEWSRPAARTQGSGPDESHGQHSHYGDRDHNEAAWLRKVLPLLAQQGFRAARGPCATDPQQIMQAPNKSAVHLRNPDET